jgi:hypothetical protein
MVSGPQQTGTSTASTVNLGTVVEVHPTRRTVDVEVDMSGESDVHSDVPYGTLYTNAVTGTHIDFVPEVGSKCFVFTMSDGSDPMVMGWVSPPLRGAFSEDATEEPEDNYLGGRMGLAPGDMALYNAQGATVVLRKGGTLQVGCSPLAQTVYIPIDNFIRHFFQNYEAKSLLGSLYWKHGAIQTGAEKTSAQMYWGMKKDVEDDFVSIRIRAGRAGDADFSPKQSELFGTNRDKPFKFGASSYPGDPQETTIISICVDPNNTGCTYTFQIDTLGNVFTKVTGDMHWEVGSAHVFTEDGFVVKYGSMGSITAEANGDLEAKVNGLVVEALTGITLSTVAGGCTVEALNIRLGSSMALFRAVLGELFIEMLMLHEHGPNPGKVDATGTGTGFTGFPLPGARALLLQALSDKVRLE